MAIITPPVIGEYNSYYSEYIRSVQTEDILAFLLQQSNHLQELIGGLPEKKCETGYAPGKWSLKELLSHITDVERVFSYRAMRFARKDRTPLTGFEQDDYVAASNADRRSLNSLLSEFNHLRLANIALFESFEGMTLHQIGEANNNQITVRAIIWIIAGHTEHHIKVIKERYI